MLGLAVVQKIKKRYYETHENAVILIKPDVKWSILKSSTKSKEVVDYMKKLFSDEKYNNSYLTIVSVNCNEKSASVSLGIDFYFYKDSKNVIGKSFGKSIVFSSEKLSEIGDITHQTISEVVEKMFKKGKKVFDGVKPMPYESL